MADFDESAIRSPRTPPQTIGVGEVEPWSVWTAAAALALLAVAGLIMGVRGGHPLSGVGMSLETGAAVDASSAKSATPAAAIPKDPQWSTLSGPEVVVKSAAPSKVAAAQDDQDDDTDSGAPDDDAAAAQSQPLTPPPLVTPSTSTAPAQPAVASPPPTAAPNDPATP
jgi:hypothetical protein